MDEKTPTTDENPTTTPANATDAAPATTDEGDVPATDAAAPAETGHVAIVGTASEKSAFLGNLTQDAVYLMGLSFLVGVLFTVFILLVFDFMRRNSSDTTTTTIK